MVLPCVLFMISWVMLVCCVRVAVVDIRYDVGLSDDVIDRAS